MLMNIALLMLGALVSQSAPWIHVSALPAPGGFVDAESKRRDDSALDLANALTREGVHVSGGTDLFVVVTSSQVEETGKVELETRNRPEILGGGQRTEAVNKEALTVRVQLNFKDYKKEFVGRDESAWTGAARDAAKQIRSWMRDNQSRICQASPVSCGG